ncbi:sugar phosphate isomerase/epimerase [Rathayibacter rathayi]|uniref:Sugar phosphate isomerase/epimerase n=1 Tax=Rathayibacter rathayi TaxID=33887 RepID=A0ABX5AB55_RATRA|nr:sugar phosphate isomerase/epimerase [Rathayibacter rathayi]PPG68208.1 sugar phosphate isomerase/epimerase [Rathayibacter rathayi]PPG76328.1 sugar phosphate isomerase/epimerase [Rathayibacter rathayi]PPG88416.1 sugar phosphate isomerase/epimerase [Rathayibacter rathayi]PPG96280.1 sugar phosphate isomerase/epimerase [Rathayibacter rathayi]PPH36548.1 sugar phosphate isomerase/epimerase [Rathayibacter rathayi]
MATPPHLSVQLYSVREPLAADLPATLERLAGIGFATVELFGFVDLADAYRAALAASGLRAPSAHARLLGPQGDVTVDEILDVAASLGVQTVIDPFVDPTRWSTADDVARIADELNALIDSAAARGLVLGYHNHAFEFENRIDGRAAFEHLAGLLDPRMVLELDTYWAAVGGDNPVDVLGRLGDQVRFLHVKDGPISADIQEQMPAGEGAMDVSAILAAAPQALPVLEFDAYAGDIFAGLESAHRYVSGLRA